MAFSLRFGDFTLEGCRQVHGRNSYRVTQYRVARRPGSIAPRVPAKDNTTFNFHGDLWRDNEAQVIQWFELLGKKLDNGRDRLYLRDNDRYLNSVAEFFEWDFIAEAAPSVHASYDLAFNADDPFVYHPTQSEQLEQVGAANTHNFSVTNDGGARTPMVIEVKRTGTSNEQDNVRIEHTTTGFFMQWAGTLLPVNSSVSFDSVNQKVIALGGNGLTTFTGSVRIELEPGVNNFLYTGPGDVDILIAWIKRWGLS